MFNSPQVFAWVLPEFSNHAGGKLFFQRHGLEFLCFCHVNVICRRSRQTMPKKGGGKVQKGKGKGQGNG